MTILVLAGLLFAFQPNSNRAKSEQYAVYSAYIEDGLTGDSHSLGERSRTVLIHADSTMVAELKNRQRFRFLVGSLVNLHSRTIHPRPSLIYQLFLSNLTTGRFDRRFNISADYELLDCSSILSSPNIHERFPRNYGCLTFSSVAFSPDLAEALFYTEHLCGLCGGEFVLMRKTGGRWAVVNHYGTWVS